MDTNTFIQLFEQIGLTACIIGGFAWYIVKKDKEKAIYKGEFEWRNILILF